MDLFFDWIKTTGIYNLSWQNLVMFAVAFFFMYLAIKKNMESYELLPIGLGIIIANLPLAGMAVFDATTGVHQSSGIFGVIFYYTLSFWNILPPIIFLGLGAITDFTPLINNPKTILLGAAAQIGIFVSFWLGFPQIRHLKHGIEVTGGKFDNPDDEGDVTHFQALSAALSATIGIGNIAGVAIAIRLGGPGALFWMWVTALLGMALKYAECTLSHHYRVINEDGSASGGPMYYIEKGLGPKWKPLAVIFASCAVTFSMFLMLFPCPPITSGVCVIILKTLIFLSSNKSVFVTSSILTTPSFCSISFFVFSSMFSVFTMQYGK